MYTERSILPSVVYTGQRDQQTAKYTGLEYWAGYSAGLEYWAEYSAGLEYWAEYNAGLVNPVRIWFPLCRSVATMAIQALP